MLQSGTSHKTTINKRKGELSQRIKSTDARRIIFYFTPFELALLGDVDHERTGGNQVFYSDIK